MGVVSLLVLPSPKSHSYELTAPSILAVKVTSNGAVPDRTSASNEATGGIGVAVGVGAGVDVAGWS